MKAHASGRVSALRIPISAHCLEPSSAYWATTPFGGSAAPLQRPWPVDVHALDEPDDLGFPVTAGDLPAGDRLPSRAMRPDDAARGVQGVRFGLSLSGMIQEPRDGDLRRRLGEIVAWVRRARSLGFEYLVTGRHYLTREYQTFQPLPLLARLAAETGEMRLVPAVLLPPPHPGGLARAAAAPGAVPRGRRTRHAARRH